MRKCLRGALALLVCVLLAGSACAQEAIPVATVEEGTALMWAYLEAFEQAMQDAPKGGLYYFSDLAGAVEDCTVFTEYWSANDTLYEERVLDDMEYAVADAPDGLIALTVTPDRSRERQGYTYSYVIGIRNEAMGVTVYGYPYQAFPDTLYHYSVSLTGVSGDDIREMWFHYNRYLASANVSGVENRFELNWIMNGFLRHQEAAEESWLDGDIHFVGGDLWIVQILPWDETIAAETADGDREDIRTGAQASDLRLAVGERMEVPLEGLTWEATATVTKHAALREGGGLINQVERDVAEVVPGMGAPTVTTASSTQTTGATPAAGMKMADAGMIVVHEECNIRKGPGGSYGVLDKAVAGDTYNAVGTDPNGWYVIRMRDGRFGYIAISKADYVE